MLRPSEQFRFCPRCGHAQAATSGSFRCPQCQFLLFFNAASACGAFLRRENSAWLFIRRARDPAKGKLALPGGFLEMGETAEEGLRREILEEVGIRVGHLSYVTSCPNDYLYEGVSYPVLDLFYRGDLETSAHPKALEDVAELCWRTLDEISPDEVAFPSICRALRHLRSMPER